MTVPVFVRNDGAAKAVVVVRTEERKAGVAAAPTVELRSGESITMRVNAEHQLAVREVAS